MNPEYLSALPEASPMGASVMKFALWLEFRMVWVSRIGPLALKQVPLNGPCSVCGHRVTMFSIGEWRCGRHLHSLVGEEN